MSGSTHERLFGLHGFTPMSTENMAVLSTEESELPAKTLTPSPKFMGEVLEKCLSADMFLNLMPRVG